MGGGINKNGITLSFYDPDGNPDTTRKPITYPSCWITGQPQGTPGVGSEDWIKEVYMAPDPASLYALMRTIEPTGTSLLFTTAASQNITIHYVAADGKTMKSEQWKSAIAGGTDSTVTLGDGTTAPFRLFDSLQVSQGDAAADKNNGLFDDFKKAKPFLPPG
jgi:hypothetical protein